MTRLTWICRFSYTTTGGDVVNCKKCAGLLSFDPETELLICTICGHSVVPPLRIVEQDIPPVVKDPQERQAQALDRIAVALEKLVESRTPTTLIVSGLQTDNSEKFAEKAIKAIFETRFETRLESDQPLDSVGPLFKFDPSEVAGKTFVYTCPFCKETVEVDIMNPHNCREPRP